MSKYEMRTYSWDNTPRQEMFKQKSRKEVLRQEHKCIKSYYFMILRRVARLRDRLRAEKTELFANHEFYDKDGNRMLTYFYGMNAKSWEKYRELTKEGTDIAKTIQRNLDAEMELIDQENELIKFAAKYLNDGRIIEDSKKSLELRENIIHLTLQLDIAL